MMKSDIINKMTLVLVIGFVCVVASSIYVGGLGENESSLESSFITNTKVPSNVPLADDISPWDLNGDGTCDLHDLQMVADHYGETGSLGWIPEDINEDDKVDILDISSMSAHYRTQAGDIEPENPPLSPGVTYINITPPSQTVGPGDSFIVGVYVDPGEPIIGVQVDLSFDAALIQADSVTKGDSCWDTFFQSGTIDNTSGKITGIGGAIMGDTISDPVYLCNISFTAQYTSGTSDLDLHDVIVTDANGDPIPPGDLTVNDGNAIVDADEPDTTIDPLNNYYNTPPGIGGTATDQSFGDLDKIEMKIQRGSDNKYWDGSLWQDSETWYDADTGLSGWDDEPWTASSLPSSWDNEVTYTIDARAYDDVGNVDSTPATDSFTYDTIYPEASINAIDDYVNYEPDITGGATDNLMLNHVDVQITYDDGTVYYWDFTGSWTTTVTWEEVSVTGNSNPWDLTGTDPTDSDYTSDQLYYVHARATDEAGNEESTATESFTFDNTNPAITVTAPNGNEYWAGSKTITWNSVEANKDVVDIEYTTDGGSNWFTIVPGSPDDGSHIWDTTTVSDGSSYEVRVTATDKALNTGSDMSDAVFTVDNTNPIISNVDLTFSDPIDTDPTYGWDDITCDVIDATSGVNEVYVDITYPDLHTESHLMTDGGGGQYYYNTTYTDVGQYSYYIRANDNAQNEVTSTTDTFDVPPNWDINMDGVCNIIDVSRCSVEWMNSSSNNGWIREDINNDGKVDIIDVSQISVHWDEPWLLPQDPPLLGGALNPSMLSNDGNINPPTVDGADTYVSITPSSQTVDYGESFTVGVYIDPSEPIIGVQVDLSFDAALIQADSVTKGDDIWNFFQGGTINNTNGEITGIGGAILGGTISTPVYLCNISFTAQYTSGTSDLDLYDVIVTDENGDPIPPGDLTVNDGSVTVAANTPPLISNPDPSNGATDVSISLDELSVTIEDPEGDSFDWSIETSPYIGDSSGSGEGNGTKTCSVSGLSYSTTYTWYVNATDKGGSGDTTSEVYTFTTEAAPNYPPEFSNENPSHGATGVPITTSSLSVYISDPEGDSFDWSIETSPNVGSSSGTGYDGTKICSVSGLSYSTTYTWYVNASDTGGSGLTTSEVYTFTTKANVPPSLGTPNPANGSTDRPLAFTWSIPIYEQDDLIDWSIECSNGQSNGATNDNPGTKSLALSGLSYSITYTVWVNVTDGYAWVREWFTFTTKDNNPPVFSNENPSDGQIDVPITTSSLSVTIEDPEGDSFDWSIETSPYIGDSSGSGEGNGTKSCSVSGLSYSTTYTWFVNATDTGGSGLTTSEVYTATDPSKGSGETTSEVYTFTTESAPNYPPVFSDENPSHGAINVPVTTSLLTVYISDPEGDSFDWSIETSPYIGDSSGSGEGNGTKFCSVSGLSYSTTYTWFVNASDPGGSGDTTSEVYTFTTEAAPNYPPEFSNENPSNGQTNVPITTSTLSVTIEDPEGDSFDWSIETSPNVGSSSGTGYDGTKTCSVSGLSYSTTYTWYVNATDTGGSGETTEEVYTFTTEQNSPPDAPTIDGPTSGKAGEPHEYTFNATDPDGDQIYYYVDWGDTSVQDWFGPFDSGEEATASHTWSEGTFTIRAKAKDIFGAESDWGTLEVTMPVNYQRSQQSSNPLFSFFQTLERILTSSPLVSRILGGEDDNSSLGNSLIMEARLR